MPGFNQGVELAILLLRNHAVDVVSCLVFLSAAL